MTKLLRTKMVLMAARIMSCDLGMHDARQRAEDIVHDALVFHLERGPWDERRFVGAVCFYAKNAKRLHFITLTMPEGGTVRPNPRAKTRRAPRPTTSMFPVQIFGCSLADAFNGPVQEAA